MGSLWSFLAKPKNQKMLSWLGGSAVVVIAGLWAAFVYLFPPKKDGEGSGPQVKTEIEREGWRLRHREQRDCDRQHGQLRVSASGCGAKTMTRAALLAAVALSAALIAFGQQTAVALGDTKVEAGSCAIANSGIASGNTITCNFGLTPEQLKQVTEAAVKGATEPLTHQIVEISKTLGVTEDAAKTLLEDRWRRCEHSRRQAGRSADQGGRRLQEIAVASCGVEPGQSDGAKTGL